MRVALVSMNQEWLMKEKNKFFCKKIIENYKSLDIELIIFPEMTLTGFCTTDISIAEDINNSSSINFFKNLSKDNNISIIFGASFTHTQSKLRNSLIYVNPLTEYFQSYSKIHPFSQSRENLHYQSGNQIVILNHQNIPLGASICYDLRFPILFNLMAELCQGVICIANWPSIRIEHWHSLLKSRAIENQLFIFGVNRDGIDGNKNIYKKSSVIFSPSGKLVKPFLSEGALDLYDINFNDVKIVRENFKISQDNILKNYLDLKNEIQIKVF